MGKYPKIQSVFKRDPANKNKTFLFGQYSTPEIEYLANNDWVFTEKVDGTNVRVMIDGQGGLTFGGKTNNAQLPTKLFERLTERFRPQQDALAAAFPDGACLYGEGYGTGIQSGGNYRPDQDFVLFDVRVDDWWLKLEGLVDVAAKFGLTLVPCVGGGTLRTMLAMVEHGFRSAWGDFTAEGIVARPRVELRDRNGERIITKVKYKDFR